VTRARILAPVAWMVLIFWSSSRAWPGADAKVLAWLPAWLPDVVQIDKLVHAGIYGALAGLWAWALGHRWRLCWVLATGFGALDEVHQGFVPGRSRDIQDLLADGLGAAAMLGLWIGLGSVRARLARGVGETAQKRDIP
jgi:VanZ family protein